MDTGCVHTVEDLFTKMRKDSSLQDEMTLLHQTIRIFKHPLKHATWIHGIRMNVQKKFKIKIVQILFSLKLHSFESSELKQRERGWPHDFGHEIIFHYREKGECCDFIKEIITRYKKNQVNSMFRKKMRAKRDVTYCWFDQKFSDPQLNKLFQPSFHMKVRAN